MELFFLWQDLLKIEEQLNQLEGYIESSKNNTFRKLNQSKLIDLKKQRDKILIKIENKKKESIK
jgi:hypothetical protein